MQSFVIALILANPQKIRTAKNSLSAGTCLLQFPFLSSPLNLILKYLIKKIHKILSNSLLKLLQNV